MDKAFPLQTLLDLSQTRLDDATRQLGKLMADEQQALNRLQLLENYRAEYQNRLVHMAQSGISLEQWRNFQVFLDRLDTAIAQAKSAAEHSQRSTAAGQNAWLKEREQNKAYDTLSTRHQAKQHYEAQKRDQKAQDEHAARKSGSEE